jgi:septal ring factor EnvC (AmiA/AmiB activator)
MFKEEPKPKKKVKVVEKPLDLTPILDKLSGNAQSIDNLTKVIQQTFSNLQQALESLSKEPTDTNLPILEQLTDINANFAPFFKAYEKIVTKVDESNKEQVALLLSIQKQLGRTNDLLAKIHGKEPEEKPKEWEFTIDRDTQGIKKVIAKAK